jgi:hypothetical protein
MAGIVASTNRDSDRIEWAGLGEGAGVGQMDKRLTTRLGGGGERQ